MNSEVCNKVQRLLDIFHKYRNDPKLEIDYNFIYTVMEVAKDQGVTVKDLKEKLGQTNGSASRNFARIGKEMKVGKEIRKGFDLVNYERYSNDWRQQIAHPNARLIAMMAEIEELFS